MAQARMTFFSGTGNTRWVAERLGAGLRGAGYDVIATEIAARIDPATGRIAGGRGSGPGRDVEVEVFLFPVFAFALPHLVRRALRRLPHVPMRPAAVVAVFGSMFAGRRERRRMVPGYEGGALMEARRLLERRGYVVFASHAVGLPVSYTQFFGAPPLQEQAQITTAAEAEIADMARSLARKEESHRPFATAHWLWNLPVRAAFRLVGRRLSGKLFVADASCDGCGLCARRCPASTIRMHGRRPRWGWKCEACQRCINECPRSAIQTSLARTPLMTAAAVLPYNRVFRLDALWGRVGFLGEWGSRAFWVGSWLVCALLALLVVDALLFAAEGPLALRRVLSWSFTRRHLRYRGPDPRAPR